MTMLDHEHLPREENYRRALQLLDSLQEVDLNDVVELPGIDEGPCDDCGRAFGRARVLYGRFILCRVCARSRANVLKAAA
jgi:hypothetical protein